MATFGSFVSGQVLTAAELNSLGVWTSFTPSYTQLSVGNGTISGFYTVINKMLFVQTSFTLGSTSSVGAGPVTLTLPASLVQASVTDSIIGQAYYVDAGVASYIGVCAVSNTTTVIPYVDSVGGTYGTLSSITNTRPFTFGTGDSILLNFMTRLT